MFFYMSNSGRIFIISFDNCADVCFHFSYSSIYLKKSSMALQNDELFDLTKECIFAATEEHYLSPSRMRFDHFQSPFPPQTQVLSIKANSESIQCCKRDE